MKKNSLTYHYLFALILLSLPAVASAAITYSRSPQGTSITSPVTITVSAESFKDFGLSAGVDQFYVTLDDDYNPHSNCYPVTQLPVTVSFHLPPGDLVKGVLIVGFTGYCETGDEPYYLEGNGESNSVAFTVAGAPAQSGTSKAAVVSATPTKLTYPGSQSVPSAIVTHTSNTTTTPATSSATSGWLRDLFLGVVGDDVRELQVWLNTHGYVIATTGPGSPGLESNYFGKLTQAALIKFQRASGITPQAGYFGPKTRGAILVR